MSFTFIVLLNGPLWKNGTLLTGHTFPDLLNTYLIWSDVTPRGLLPGPELKGQAQILGWIPLTRELSWS